MFFDVLSNNDSCKARSGIIKTPHSNIETPVFMPIGTTATVKAITHRDIEEFDTRILLANTYHLYLRPGTEILEKAGGLHQFMNWKSSILTDSGGFQIFSLASLRKITEEGVEFSSHLDGSRHFFTPEKIIEIERVIGSDIMMCLDECLENPAERKKAEKSLKITSDWEKRCLEYFNHSQPLYGNEQYLFAICQGSTYEDLRKMHIEEMAQFDFAGFAIGGLAVGEESSVMYDIVELSTEYLPLNKPRYLMGVGTPIDILECVEKGIDMFDCVLPTRNARHGRLFTTYGEVNLKNSSLKFNFNSPDEECKTYTSENFSLAYLRHLFIAKEILGMQLATIHNLGFYLKLMKDIRNAIRENNFMSFKNEFLTKYLSNKLKN
jgi:queuine tRNA-ribosyltransferase